MTAMAKTGRNEPCPCGSGKKYKNCHLKEEALAKKDMRMPMAIAAIGAVAGVIVAVTVSLKMGVLAAAGGVLVAVGVAAFRDPPESKGDESNPASINFGR